MATIGKLRQGIASIRPWLGKVNGYKEILAEFFGKAANKYSTVPFLGDMARRAQEVVDTVAGPALKAVSGAVSVPLKIAEQGLDVLDKTSEVIQDVGKEVNKLAREYPTISNALLDKPINYSSVVRAPGPVKESYPVLNPRENVVGKAKKTVMAAAPVKPSMIPAPTVGEALVENEVRRFGRRGKK
jgi:hypothetical protein